MLILSRKENESIILQWGEAQAKVKIFEIKPWCVKIGVEAPKSVSILRDELVGRPRPKDAIRPTKVQRRNASYRWRST